MTTVNLRVSASPRSLNFGNSGSEHYCIKKKAPPQRLQTNPVAPQAQPNKEPASLPKKKSLPDKISTTCQQLDMGTLFVMDWVTQQSFFDKEMNVFDANIANIAAGGGDGICTLATTAMTAYKYHGTSLKHKQVKEPAMNYMASTQDKQLNEKNLEGAQSWIQYLQHSQTKKEQVSSLRMGLASTLRDFFIGGTKNVFKTLLLCGIVLPLACLLFMPIAIGIGGGIHLLQGLHRIYFGIKEWLVCRRQFKLLMNFKLGKKGQFDNLRKCATAQYKRKCTDCRMKLAAGAIRVAYGAAAIALIVLFPAGCLALSAVVATFLTCLVGHYLITEKLDRNRKKKDGKDQASEVQAPKNQLSQISLWQPEQTAKMSENLSWNQSLRALMDQFIEESKNKQVQAIKKLNGTENYHTMVKYMGENGNPDVPAHGLLWTLMTKGRKNPWLSEEVAKTTLMSLTVLANKIGALRKEKTTEANIAIREYEDTWLALAPNLIVGPGIPDRAPT